MNLTTPTLLFSAISLLLLAYTNRFLTLAQLIRQLAAIEEKRRREFTQRQLHSLQKRVFLTKIMQAAGVTSFLLCTLSSFALFLSKQQTGIVLFGASIVFLAGSLLISLWEIIISTDALKMELRGLEEMRKKAN